MAELNVTIKQKTGLQANLPASAAADELLIAKDTGRAYIGMGEGFPLQEIGAQSQLITDMYEFLFDGIVDFNDTLISIDLNNSPLKLDFE